MEFNNLINRFNRWLDRRQEKALEEAYASAKAIEQLERQYFDGEKIAYQPEVSKTVYDYARNLRDRQLLVIRSNLTQFNLGNFVFNRQPQNPEFVEIKDNSGTQNDEIIQKLNYIESVISKYREEEFFDPQTLDSTETISPDEIPSPTDTPNSQADLEASIVDPPIIETKKSRQKQARGLFGKLKPFRSEIKEVEYERQAIINIRQIRQQNRIASRWLIIIIVIPLLSQILAKNLFFDPFLGDYSNRNPQRIELTEEIQEKFEQELTLISDKLDVKSLLGIIPELTPETKKEKLKEAAVELWQEARNEELNGFKNLLSDGVGLAVFAALVYFGRDKVAVLRKAINRSFLNLYDPVKVFLFILITDIFVGFHSAEGWEVILEGISEHFGIPASDKFIKAFIATVPVFLDSCLKFWIFNYLTRFAPASSAIYERMNT